jgi:hypothetical protein
MDTQTMEAEWEAFVPKLEFAFESRLTLKPRLRIDDLPMGGARLSVPVGEGTFEGPRLKGRVMSEGGEWPHVRTDDVFCFDARYFLEEEDGTIIYLQNRGYRWGSPEVMERLWKLTPGDVVTPFEYYFRCTPTFECAPGKHDWLTKHVFIGVGARFEDGNRIRYFSVL